MSQLIVLGFDSVTEAQDVRKELVALQQDHLIALEDAVVEAGIIEGDTHRIVSEILITRDYISGKNSYIILRLSKAGI